MTLKSRKLTSKKSASNSKWRSTTASSIKSVKDAAVLKREALVPNTSAFQNRNYQ
jgi:hypothetical protein